MFVLNMFYDVYLHVLKYISVTSHKYWMESWLMHNDNQESGDLNPDKRKYQEGEGWMKTGSRKEEERV